MYKITILLFLTVISNHLFSQTVNYKLMMSKPQSHYYEVEMEISGLKGKEFDVKMPVWAPGSYLVREFSRNVNLVKAFDEKGTEITVSKISKNKWKVAKSKSSTIKIKYEVYAFELSVRTSFLDLTHGFVSGTSIFMYTEETKSKPGKLEIVPFKDFKTITTALKNESVNNYSFNNYDQLVDCPIEIGNQEVFEFQAAGVNHTVGIYGSGNHNIEKLKVDMAKIVETTSNVVGVNPNKDYTFIIHNVVNGQGGLEHMNSTTLSVNRWTYEGSDYLGFLSLVAHEYFHLWNVKRIRPIELGPFNYDEENYTTLLWVMEGVTSYYDELILLRAGYYSTDTYINKLLSSLNYVEGTVGSRVQPVAHASFDAWIKGYRPNENSSNTTMTYYSRGAVIAACLDAMIIKQTDGKKKLDDFLRSLYDNYYLKLNRGFTDKEFQESLEKFIGYDLDTFFNDYVYGTKVIDYKTIFAPIGVEAIYTGVEKPSFGASLSQSGNKLTVRSVRSNSSAETAGLSVNDEIIGCNGYRVDQRDFESMLSSMENGQELSILVSRDEVLLELKVVIMNYERPQYQFHLLDDSKTNHLKETWLKKD
jgi:predicted metalloprotease with PDZ domain